MTRPKPLTDEQLIASLREGRDIHAGYIDYLRGKGDPGAQWTKTSPGGVRWHRRWVRVYEAALARMGAG